MNSQQYTDSSVTSIAVLPFVNMSTDPDNEYFSDGITEEIINALTTIQGLKVIARTSSFAFKNKNIDVRTIGNQLGVSTVLEGSVRKARSRVRITAQLIETKDGTHLWSKNYDRELEDVFVIQDEISLLIADRIRENFGHLIISDKLVNFPDIDSEVYQLYLKGWHHVQLFNLEHLTVGIEQLKQVVELAPQFALAHVNIHYAYNTLAASGLMPMKEALGIGKTYLDTAIAIDKNLPEAYHSLGWHSLNHDWDFKQSEAYLQRAIELRPGYAEAHQKLFISLALEGRLPESYVHIQKALVLDPLSPLSNYFQAYYYYLVENFERANQYFKRTFELDDKFLVGYSINGLCLVLQGRPDRIGELVARIPNVSGAKVERLILQALAAAAQEQLTDDSPVFLSIRAELEGPFRERVRFFMIYIEMLRGNPELAIEYIKTGIPNGEPLLTLLQVDPLLRPMHSIPSFQSAMTIIFTHAQSPKVVENTLATALMDDQEIAQAILQLDAYMGQEKPYLESGLSLRELAEAIDLHPNKLSWLVNDRLGQNFNQYINSFRLDTFKTKALDPANAHLTLLGLAFESGFNSKTVFNTFFKRTEGMTPRAWLKSNQS